MKVICLGGAGKICREAILDLVQFSTFDKITVALKSVRVSHGYDYGFLRNVAIPFAIATELFASGKVLKKDIVIPEEAFTDPSLLFKQLEKRGIFVKEQVIRMESKVEQGVYFMSLLAEERKRVIIELIDQIGKVRVNDLAKDFEVSTETIRRYLEELESERKLKKVYGGAVRLEDETEEPSMFEREILRIDEKRRIAYKASSYIKDREVIFIDEGSTTLQMVQSLCNCNRLTVITNSFPVASKLLAYATKETFNGEVIFIGGNVRHRHYHTSGSLAERMAKEFFVDKAFISIDGILPEEGITCFDLEKSLLSKILIKNATEVFVLADHFKLGVKANFKMASLGKIDKVLSDVNLPVEWDVQASCEWIIC